VQVHCDERVAIYISPEPCAGLREDVGEASAGECIGQVMEPRKELHPGCRRRSYCGRQNERRRYASIRSIRRGQRPWHVQTLLVREPGDLWIGHRPIGPNGPRRKGEEP
jgi:hypothetical protein